MELKLGADLNEIVRRPDHDYSVWH